MPSTSSKQHRFMEAVAHDKEFAKKAGVPQKVGKDFADADKGHKFPGSDADGDFDDKSTMNKNKKPKMRHEKMYKDKG